MNEFRSLVCLFIKICVITYVIINTKTVSFFFLFQLWDVRRKGYVFRYKVSSMCFCVWCGCLFLILDLGPMCQPVLVKLLGNSN